MPSTPSTTPATEPGEGGSDTGEDGPDIVVQGARQPGSVVGDIPPEQQLSPADIRSYGVGSVTELLTELSPQIRSDRGSGGAPVVLIDGKRISGFQEIRDLPTEAIQRVDILPEEVALKYGYRADQKVVNFVLRRRFRAATVELSDRLATAGGRNAPQAELDLLKIARTGRLNLHLEYQEANALTENERGISRTPTPFALGGNVVGVGGAAIDPALGTATIAGVPGANPTLGDFVGTAGRANATDVTPYRTLLAADADLQRERDLRPDARQGFRDDQRDARDHQQRFLAGAADGRADAAGREPVLAVRQHRRRRSCAVG